MSNPDVMPVPQPGYALPPKTRKRPVPVIRPVDAMILEIEQKEGNVTPELVMILLRAHRSLEATNRALKEEMAKHVEALKRSKARK